MADNVVSFKLAKLLRTPAPWETPAQCAANRHAARNATILQRMHGIAANPATQESDGDPHNPNIR